MKVSNRKSTSIQHGAVPCHFIWRWPKRAIRWLRMTASDRIKADNAAHAPLQ
jgi:hypothetical protein